VIPEKGLHRIDPGWVPVSRQRYGPTPESSLIARCTDFMLTGKYLAAGK